MKKILTLGLLALSSGLAIAGITFSGSHEKVVDVKADDAPAVNVKEIYFEKTDFVLTMGTNNAPSRVQLALCGPKYTDWAGGYLCASDANFPKIASYLGITNDQILINGQPMVYWNNQLFRAPIAGNQTQVALKIDNFSSMTTLEVTLKAGLTLPSRAYVNNLNSSGTVTTDVYRLVQDYTIVFEKTAGFDDANYNVGGSQPMTVKSMEATLKGDAKEINFSHYGYGTPNAVNTFNVVNADINRVSLRIYLPDAYNDIKDFSTLGYQASDGDSNSLINVKYADDSYNKYLVKARMSAVNMWSKFLVNGQPATIFSNDTTRIWYRAASTNPADAYLFLNFTIDISTFDTFTIPAGTQFPGCRWVAEGGATPTFYVAKETTTYHFNKTSKQFERYCTKAIDMSNVSFQETDITNAYLTKEGSNTSYQYLNLVCPDFDYGDFGNPSVITTGPDGIYDAINHSNMFDGEHVLINGQPLTKDLSGARSARFRTSYGYKGIGAVCGYYGDNVSTIFVKKGTIFGSKAAGNASSYEAVLGQKFFKTKRDVTFTYNSTIGGYEAAYADVETHDTRVGKIALSENSTGKSFRMHFHLSEFDYTGGTACYDGYLTPYSNIYTHVTIDGSPASTLFGNSTLGYRGHRLENGNKMQMLQLTGDFATVSFNKIVVAKGTEFRSVSVLKGTATKEQVYVTTEERTFVQTTNKNTYEDLSTLRSNACLDLEGYKTLTDYRTAEQGTLNTAITNGKTAVNAAETYAAINSAVATAKAAMDAIKTDAVLTAEELVAAKATACNELDAYKSADDYRDAEKQTLAAAIVDGKEAINACTVIGDVSTALANAKTAIDAIKTNAQYVAEELAAAKQQACDDLDAYRATKLDADYREAQVTELDNAVLAGKTAINAVEVIDDVAGALANAKAALDAVKTNATLTAEELAAAKAEAIAYINGLDISEYTIAELNVGTKDNPQYVSLAQYFEMVKAAIADLEDIADVATYVGYADSEMAACEKDAVIIAARESATAQFNNLLANYSAYDFGTIPQMILGYIAQATSSAEANYYVTYFVTNVIEYNSCTNDATFAAYNDALIADLMEEDVSYSDEFTAMLSNVLGKIVVTNHIISLMEHYGDLNAILVQYNKLILMDVYVAVKDQFSVEEQAKIEAAIAPIVNQVTVNTSEEEFAGYAEVIYEVLVAADSNAELLIAALPEVVTLDDEAAIVAARAAVDAVPEDYEGIVENVAVLEAAEAQLATLKAAKALADHKAAKVEELEDAYAALNLEKYSEDNKKVLESIVDEYKKVINEAETVEEADAAATAALAALAAVEEAKVGGIAGFIEGCMGSAVAATGIIALVTLLGAGLAVGKKRKEG